MKIWKKGKAHSSSTYYKWFISYICVLIIPFVFGCMIYAKALSSVQLEVDAIQELNLNTTENVVNNALQDAKNTSEALLCDKNLALLMNLPEGAGGSEAALIQDITNTIRHYKTANQVFSSIYICMTEKEYILSESACYQYKWIASTAENFLGVDYSSFLRMTEGNTYNRFYMIGKGNECEGIYVHSSGRYQNRKAPVVILVRFDMNVLGEMLTAEDYLTCLYHSEDGYLLSNGLWPENHEQILADVLSGKNHEYYLLRKNLPNEENIQVVNLMEKQMYLYQVKKMKYILIVYILCCLIAGGALAAYLARRNYSPVRELADMAEKVSGQKGNPDDFTRIKSSMERLTRDYSEYRNMEKKTRQYARESLLARFLQERCFGRHETFQVYELLENLFGSQKVLMLAYEAEEQEGAEESDVERLEDFSLDQLELPYFVLKNVTVELLEEKYASFCLECQGKMICLLGIPAGLERQAMSDARMITAKVCEYAKTYFQYSIVADISSIHDNGPDLLLAYGEIMELIKFRDLIGSPLEVIAYVDFRKDTSEEGAEQYRRICKIQQLIEERKYDNAAELLQSLCRSKQETEEEEELHNQAREKSRNNPDEMMKEVAAYIDEHYEDKNLTVGFLADQMGLGLSNLSQMFKRYRGCGLLDYINQVRLAQAKHLLIQGKSVKETADLVGFYTTRPLTNLFNQLESMTPLKWKNQMQKAEQEKTQEGETI